MWREEQGGGHVGQEEGEGGELSQGKASGVVVYRWRETGECEAGGVPVLYGGDEMAKRAGR